jgi:serine O-acetyltransferase
MTSLAKSFYWFMRMLTLLPHIVTFATSSERWKIKMDLEGWSPGLIGTQNKTSNYKLYKDFVRIMDRNPEFRNLFYCRIGDRYPVLNYILKCLCAPESTLYINTPSSKIGPGLFILHGFSTIIAASSIGSNCIIGQQVTIGASFKVQDLKGLPTSDNVNVMPAGIVLTGCPTIEDNVKIMPGARLAVIQRLEPMR